MYFLGKKILEILLLAYFKLILEDLQKISLVKQQFFVSFSYKQKQKVQI